MLGLNGPGRGFAVPFCGGDLGIEGNVFADVENFVDVLEVVTDLSVIGKAFREVEGAIDLGNAELVDGKLRVDSCSWIGVVPPYAAK